MDLKVASAAPSDGRAGRCRRSVLGPVRAPGGAVTPPGTTCARRPRAAGRPSPPARARCTPSTTGSGGSAAGRSTTSPSASTSHRPTSTAWPRSTPCSRPSSGRPAGPRLRRPGLPRRGRADRARAARRRPPVAVPRRVRAGAGGTRGRGRRAARHEVLAPATPSSPRSSPERGRVRAPSSPPSRRSPPATASLELLGRVGVVDPAASTTTGQPAATRRCGGRSPSGRRR